MSEIGALRNLRARINDQLAYMEIYAPAFPAEDRTNLSTEFARVHEALKEYFERTNSPEQRKWLELAQQELSESERQYAAGDKEAGRRVLQRAQEYIAKRDSRESTRPKFFLGPGDEST
jgi:hypothetical protein